MEGCLLCLEINNESMDSIKVNSTQWQELNVKELIEKYFWPLQTIQLSSRICKTCWEELNSFHKFYIRIEDAHIHFSSIIKIEIENENETKTETSKLNTEEEYIITDFDDDLGNDDTPLMEMVQYKKQVTPNIDETIIKHQLKANGKFKQIKAFYPKNKTNVSIKNDPKDILTKKPSIEQTQIKQTPDLFEEINEDSNNEDSDSVSNNDQLHKTSFNNKNMENDIFLAENFKMTCNICQIHMETFQALCNHFHKEHKQRGYVMCCNRAFYRRHFILDHIHQHLDPNYLKCKYCNKVLANRKYLTAHIRNHEGQKKRYDCDICGISYSTNSTLYSHKKTLHLKEEEKMFPCSECGKRFGTNCLLSNHIKKTHITSCDICGLISNSNYALRKHKNDKHSMVEKIEYTCSI